MSIDQKLLKRILEYTSPKPGSIGGGWPRNPRDWIYKFATPEKRKQQVVMFQVDLSIPGLSVMQLRDAQNRFDVLWKMPYRSDRWGRQIAMDYAARYAQQQHWQIVPYAITSFVGSL